MPNEEDTAVAEENASTSPEEEAHTHPFWPNHVIDQIIQAYLLLALLLTLAVLLPFGLHDKADPLVTPQHIKPEWYFLPMYQAIKYVPELFGLGASAVVVLAIILWPFIDAAIMRRFPGARYFHVYFVIVMLFIIVGLGVLGKVSGRTVHVFGRTYEVNDYGVPHAVTPKPDEAVGGEGH
ncbi:MAG: hypothetical protein ACE5O2_10780 [Armatimonadota bacterium]